MPIQRSIRIAKQECMNEYSFISRGSHLVLIILVGQLILQLDNLKYKKEDNNNNISLFAQCRQHMRDYKNGWLKYKILKKNQK